MPKRYAQIINSIEMLLDFEQVTIKDMTGMLKAVQDRKGPHTEPSTAGGKLLYTTEQWRTFDKKKDEAFGSGPPWEHHRRPRGIKKEEKGP